MTINAEEIARNWIEYGEAVLQVPGANDDVIGSEEFMSVARALLVAVEALEEIRANKKIETEYKSKLAEDALAKICALDAKPEG